MWKLSLSTKFIHQEIRSNYGIFCIRNFRGQRNRTQTERRTNRVPAATKKKNTENKKLETRNKNRKNDGRERKIGETKSENITRLQNVTENGEQGMCMECIDDI